MSLSRRNGTYYYWYVGPNGKRKKVSTHATTKSKALEFLRNYKEPELFAPFASVSSAMRY
jgi:hypothetical protein